MERKRKILYFCAFLITLIAYVLAKIDTLSHLPVTFSEYLNHHWPYWLLLAVSLFLVSFLYELFSTNSTASKGK